MWVGMMPEALGPMSDRCPFTQTRRRNKWEARTNGSLGDVSRSRMDLLLWKKGGNGNMQRRVS